MQFHKMHGTANDFIVVDARRAPDYAWSEFAMRVCDRHRGIGADGVLLVAGSRVADLRMRLFNADGGEAEMCGNGIRCTAKFALDTGITDRVDLTWETGACPVRTEVLDRDGDTARVRVDMGVPRLRPAEIPVAWDGEDALHVPVTVNGTTLDLACVSMGNPHAVAFVDDVASYALEVDGPAVERLPDFPQRTNFEIVQLLSPERIRMRVWERGVGETMACGTGACAAAVASQLVHGTRSPLSIEVPGGTLAVEWSAGNSTYLTGPAETVFVGEVDEPELVSARSLKQPA